MRNIVLFLAIQLLVFNCKENDSLMKNVSIIPTVQLNGDTLFLKWNFKNSTDSNLIIPTLFTFRRLDLDDHNTYKIKEDEPYDLNKKIIVPYKYLRQVPNFKDDILLHNQAKQIDYGLYSESFTHYFYEYIENLNKCPPIIFLRARSEKQVVFMFKREVGGRYMMGFETKKSVDLSSLPFKGDSLIKRGVPLFQSKIGNCIKGYSFEYGEFKIDSIQVDLEQLRDQLELK